MDSVSIVPLGLVTITLGGLQAILTRVVQVREEAEVAVVAMEGVVLWCIKVKDT